MLVRSIFPRVIWTHWLHSGATSSSACPPYVQPHTPGRDQEDDSGCVVENSGVARAQHSELARVQAAQLSVRRPHRRSSKPKPNCGSVLGSLCTPRRRRNAIGDDKITRRSRRIDTGATDRAWAVLGPSESGAVAASHSGQAPLGLACLGYARGHGSPGPLRRADTLAMASTRSESTKTTECVQSKRIVRCPVKRLLVRPTLISMIGRLRLGGRAGPRASGSAFRGSSLLPAQDDGGQGGRVQLL